MNRTELLAIAVLAVFSFALATVLRPAPSTARAAEPAPAAADVVLGWEPDSSLRVAIVNLPEEVEQATARAVAPLGDRIQALEGDVALLRTAIDRLARRPPNPVD